MARYLLIAVFLLGGCAAHKPIANAPARPKDMPCGVPIPFTNSPPGEFAKVSWWIFPCWPEKDIPKCVEGCVSFGTPPTGGKG